MAALYLHNAMFVPDPPEHRVPSPHQRTISSGTVRTIGTSNSHPSEPLLRGTRSSGHNDTVAGRVPASPLHLSWGIVQDQEKRSDPGRSRPWWKLRRKVTGVEFVRIGLELVLAGLAVYHAVQYFIGYVTHASSDPQDISLALGTSVTAYLALVICIGILRLFRSKLEEAHVPIPLVHRVACIFQYAAYFFLFAPTVVNLALTIVWKNSQDPEVRFDHRCHIDIDTVWSISNTNCTSSPPWTTWLVIAICRLVLTAGLEVLHYITVRQCRTSRRTRRLDRPFRHPQDLEYEPWDPSSLQSPASNTPFGTYSNRSVSSPGRLAERKSQPGSRPSSGGQKSSIGGCSVQGSNRQSRASVETSSSEEEDGDTIAPLQPLQPTRISQKQNISEKSSPGPSTSTLDSDRDLHHFVDRFRSLVSQISRETEEGLEFARNDSGPFLPSFTPQRSESPQEDIYTRMPPRVLGYNEFGLPYPPDDHIRILNGYVRRMPTIESLGSREIAGSITSHYTGRDPERRGSASFQPVSQPPTRGNTLDYTASEPSTRRNSFSMAPPTPGGSTESSDFGELIERLQHTQNDPPFGWGNMVPAATTTPTWNTSSAVTTVGGGVNIHNLSSQSSRPTLASTSTGRTSTTTSTSRTQSSYSYHTADSGSLGHTSSSPWSQIGSQSSFSDPGHSNQGRSSHSGPESSIEGDMIA